MSIMSDAAALFSAFASQDSFEIRRRTPILGRIPIIKFFFSKKDADRTINELIVFITPEVLETRADDDMLLDRARERELNFEMDED